MDRAVHLLVRALSAVVRLLPLRMCVAIGRMLGKAGCVLLPGYRRLALRNLRIAFPEMPARELRALAREHFATLGGNLFANPKIASMSPDELRGIVEIEGAELAEKLVAEKRGIVVVISHIGNWELFAQLWPIVFKCPSGTIYQRLGNPHMDADMRASRARLGLKLFERKEGFQGAVALLREGGSVGVLVDQHAGDAGVWAPFFGRLASTSPLAATLALRTGAALVPAAVYSDAPGRWRMVIQPPLEPATRDTDTITAKINDTLETQIRRQPADWFWVHNRWKTPRPKFLLAGYKRGVVGNLGFRISDFGFGEGASDVRNRPENQKSEIRIQKSLQPFRILIRASNWLGDAVMSVPAVRAIKAGRPDAHVTILTPAKLADFWKSVPEVDATIAIERGESVFTVARSIRADFEAAIIFPNSLRAALEPWLAGIPRRVGFPGHRRAWLLHQIFRPKKKKSPEAPRHQVGHYLALAEFCGAVAGVRTSTFDVRRSTFDVFPSDRGEGNSANVERRTSNVERRSQKLGPAVIGLCPGAEYGAAKRWLPERFAEVMATIHARHGCEWKVFGVEKDRAVSEQIIRLAGIGCTDLVGRTSLGELIAHLRTCDLLLTNDTGTMHLAAHLGVPVVAVFGSTEPALTGPLEPDGGGEIHRIIRHHVACSPCFLRECPIDFRCMKAITAEEVIAAVEAGLDLAK